MNRLEKSGNFIQNTGKMREFYPKYWKSKEIFPVLFLFFSHISSNKPLKNTGKWKENTGKVGEICQSKNVGTMVCLMSTFRTFVKIDNGPCVAESAIPAPEIMSVHGRSQELCSRTRSPAAWNTRQWSRYKYVDLFIINALIKCSSK